MNRKIKKILMSGLLLTCGALEWSCNSTAEKQNDLQTMEFGLAGTSDMLYWGDTIPYYLDRTFLSSFPGYNTVLDNPDQTYDVMLLHQKLDKPYRAYWEIIDGTLYLCAIDRYGVVPTDTVNDWSRMETMIGTKFDHPRAPQYTRTRGVGSSFGTPDKVLTAATWVNGTFYARQQSCQTPNHAVEINNEYWFVLPIHKLTFEKGKLVAVEDLMNVPKSFAFNRYLFETPDPLGPRAQCDDSTLTFNDQTTRIEAELKIPSSKIISLRYRLDSDTQKVCTLTSTRWRPATANPLPEMQHIEYPQWKWASFNGTYFGPDDSVFYDRNKTYIYLDLQEGNLDVREGKRLELVIDGKYGYPCLISESSVWTFSSILERPSTIERGGAGNYEVTFLHTLYDKEGNPTEKSTELEPLPE